MLRILSTGGCLLPGGSGPGGCLLLVGGSPGPHARGKLRGIRSRPTPKGEIEGDQVHPTGMHSCNTVAWTGLRHIEQPKQSLKQNLSNFTFFTVATVRKLEIKLFNLIPPSSNERPS